MVQLLAVVPGRTLCQRYVLERELGRGRLGVVFAGRDHLLEREVAIKLIDHATDTLARELHSEAKLAAALDHPGIVPVFDFGRDDDVLFLVMPLVHGPTLAELLESGPLAIAFAAEIGRQLALTLAYSHAHGVIHRNLTPANVILTRDGRELRVMLVDFGLASLAAKHRRAGRVWLVGSRPYAAPEQLRGEPTSASADLYSLGAVLYEALTGLPPTSEEQQVPQRPAELRPAIPAELEALLLALLGESEQRPSCRAVVERLEMFAKAELEASELELPPAAASGLVSAPLAVEPTDAWTTLLHDAVGRERIVRTIDSRLVAARAGALQLILLSGELGIGKTTLLDELAVACQHREIELLRTSAARDDAGWLGPFGELLTAGLAQRPEAIDLLVDDAASLVALFPGLARTRLGRLAHKPKRESSWVGLEGLDILTAAADIDTQHAETRVEPSKSAREHTEALIVRAFAALVANGRPMTLAIDDAHVNAETVELIDLMFRRLPRAPLAFVVTYEPSEIRGQHPLSRLALRLAQHPRALSLTLEPLSEEVYDDLIEQLLGGGKPEPGLADSLFVESGGRPFFARELVRAALESGVLVQRDGIWRLEAARWPIPRSLQTSLTAALRRLPSNLITALRIAAVLAVDSGELSFTQLTELCGHTAEELEHMLTRALERRLLVERRAAGALFLRFTSELLRRVLHEELSPAARLKLHRHCAEHIRRLPFSEQYEAERHRLRLMHLIEGGDVVAARPLVVEQATRALEDGRPEQARQLLVRLLEYADSLTNPERAELLLLLAELEHARGQAHAAIEALGRLASVLEQVDEGRVSRLGERGAVLAKRLDRRSLADRLLGLHPSGQPVAKRHRRAQAELAALRPATSDRSMQVGDLLLMHGQYTAARDYYEAARRRAANDGDREEEARQLQKLARVASRLGHYESAIGYCRDGLELLAGKHSLERVGLWALAAYAHCEANYDERADAELEAGTAELATFLEPRGSDRDRVAAELERSRGAWLMARGEAIEAIDAYDRCLALIPSNDRWTVSLARVSLGQACALAGQTSRALRELERASADKRALGDRWGLVHAEIARVQVLFDLGQIRDAGELLIDACELSDEIEDARLFALVHTEAGRHALLSGKLDLAVLEGRRAKDMARNSAAASELGGAYELLANIDLVRNELPDARRHAAKAVATAELHKLDGLLITALLLLAEASAPERRPELLERARAASHAFGNPYRELDVSLTSLRLGLGHPNHAGDDYVALEQLSDRAESLSARRHVGLCLLAQAEVLAPHDLRGALDHARLGETQLRVLGASLEADRAAELIARLTLR
jgi:tetratricopeptide (TPR) repeat protein/predicted Ser/Thr protein kinase